MKVLNMKETNVFLFILLYWATIVYLDFIWHLLNQKVRS